MQRTPPLGSHVDFDGIFERLYPSLFRYLHRLTGDADAAEDVAQEAFVRLLRQKLSEDEVKKYVKSNLAGYKVPRDVEFVDELPRTSTGKVLKRELKED